MVTKTEVNNMDSPVGLFRANITPLDRVLEITVGRKEMLEDLVEKLERQAGKKGGQHYLFIGPRGIGKTHFLTLIENAVNTKKNLKKRYTVIRFPEENNRLLSFADILLGITEILGEVTDDGSWRQLHQSASENERDDDIIDTIVPRLKSYHKKTGKTLLIFLENLDTLLTEQIKQEQDIHRLRSFLMDSPCATLIGTSPVYFPSLYNQKSPLYEFFDTQVLEDLTEEQTLEMIRKNLEWEQCYPILENLESLTPKIQAIHTMTGGNPRLIMMLYELIAHDNLQDVKMQLQKLLDQISPFYQDRLKDLPPQERALLEIIALQRSEPRTPANIAKHLRKSPQQISSLLQRMTKAGYLTASDNPQDKRSRIYRIKEGFFDLWLAMSESRIQRKRLVYLVEFFEVYFSDRGERERKRKELWQKLETEKEAFKEKKNNTELLEYLSDLGDNKERSQTKLELAVHKLKEGQAPEASAFLKEAESIASKNLTFIWMREQADRWAKDNLELNVRQWLDEMIDYWRTQRSGDFEKAVEIAHKLGQDLSGRGLHKIRIELLTDALDHSTNPQQKCSLLFDMARSLQMDGQLDVARVSLEQALKIYREIGNRKGEGATLNNISHIYKARGDYATALEYLQKSLEIHLEIGNREGEGTTLNNMSQIYSARGDYPTALDYLQKSLEISRGIGNREGEGATLNNMSQIYSARGDYATALDYLQKSQEIYLEIDNREGEGITLNNISQICDARGDYVTALEYLQKSLEIRREIGDRAGEGTTLNNISHIYKARGDYATALEYLQKSLEIHLEIGNREGEGTTVNNMSQIYDAQGDYVTALDYLQKSLEIYREIGVRVGEGTTLNNMSQIYDAQGDYVTALDYLQKSLEISREIGNRAGMIATLHNMAHIHLQNGQVKEALEGFTEALQLARETNSGAGLFNIGRDFGLLLCREGKKEEGIPLLRQALDVGKAMGDPSISELEKLLEEYE